MKKLSVILIFILAQYMIVSAQSKTQEVGLNYSGYSIFGIRYNIGNEKSLFRLTLRHVGGGNSKQEYRNSNDETKSQSQGVALNVGLERLKSVADKVNFYYGPELMSSFDNRTHQDVNPNNKSVNKSIMTGIGCVLGFSYHFSDNVRISAEIVPSIWYSISKDSHSGAPDYTNITKMIGYGFNRESNAFANLTLSFRFRPKQNQ